MALYQKVDFLEKDILLSGNEYRHCIMTRCRIIFDASGPTIMSDCTMTDCHWSFQGAAGSTLNYLSLLYSIPGDGNTKRLVEELFENIKSGAMLETTIE